MRGAYTELVMPTPTDSPPQQTPEDDQYAAASQSTADFIKNVAPIQAQKKRKGRKRLIAVVVVLVLAIGAGAAYMLTKPDPKPATQSTSPTPSPAASDSTEVASEHYVSRDFGLALDHPKSWKVDDATTGKLKLESPLAKLQNSSGEQVDAKVTITLLAAGSNPEKFTSNFGTAIIDSEKIVYAAPSQTQRKETYISFLGFGSSIGIDAIFVTGDGGYKKDQGVPKTDAVKGDPIISVDFVSCTDGSECTQPLSISPEAWTSSTTLATAKVILQSLVVQ